MSSKRDSNMMYLKKEQGKLKALIKNSRHIGKQEAEKEWNSRRLTDNRTNSITPPDTKHSSRPVKANASFALNNCEKLLRLKSANATRRKQRIVQKYQTQQQHENLEYAPSAMFSERAVENGRLLPISSGRDMHYGEGYSALSSKNANTSNILKDYWESRIDCKSSKAVNRSMLPFCKIFLHT